MRKSCKDKCSDNENVRNSSGFYTYEKVNEIIENNIININTEDLCQSRILENWNLHKKYKILLHKALEKYR